MDCLSPLRGAAHVAVGSGLLPHPCKRALAGDRPTATVRRPLLKVAVSPCSVGPTETGNGVAGGWALCWMDWRRASQAQTSWEGTWPRGGCQAEGRFAGA